MNLHGSMAPIYGTITGLNERELSKELYPAGMFILKIPSLVYGGCQDVRHSKTYGYLVFTQNERDEKRNETNETICVAYYRKEVFLQWKEFKADLPSLGLKLFVETTMRLVDFLDLTLSILKGIIHSKTFQK